VLIVAVVVGRAGSADLFALELNLPYTGLAFATNIVRNFHKLQNVFLFGG
jgi:hypothetical protein